MKTIWLKATSLVVIAGVGFALGYSLSRRGQPQPFSASGEPLAATVPVAVAVPGGGQPSRQPLGRKIASVSPLKAGSLEELVSRNGLAEKLALLKKAFPDNEAGRQWAAASALLSFGPAPSTPEGKFVSARLEDLRRRPAEAFGAVRSALPLLSPELASERQFIVQFAARLDVDKRQRLDLLSSELATAPVPSALARPGEEGIRPSFFSGSAALTALMQLTDNPAEVEATLRTALKARPDRDSRLLLISQLGARDPAAARRLRDELGL